MNAREMRNILKRLFYIRKSDRRAMVFLLSFITVLTMALLVTGGHGDTLFTAGSDSLALSDTVGGTFGNGKHHVYKGKSNLPYDAGGRHAELFAFDPNTADSTQLLRLGFQPWQVRAIYRYRAAGGIYRKPEDLARMYGLTVKEYRRIEPYIRISDDYLPASTLIKETAPEPVERDTVRYPVKMKATETIELNGADTTALKRVPGIGSGYANRIVAYRERLGGFYCVEQLFDIDGLPEESLSYFTVDSTGLRKININKLTVNQMRRHPYINFHQAKAIYDYRRLQGDIKSLQQLRLHRDFTPEAIQRLEPYVEY